MNKQYQYRMKCRKAPNQIWSSWGDCSEAMAKTHLKRAKDESNLWTYEIRELIPVTSFPEESSGMELELEAMHKYTNYVRNQPNAPSWKNLPAAEIRFWLKEAEIKLDIDRQLEAILHKEVTIDMVYIVEAKKQYRESNRGLNLAPCSWDALPIAERRFWINKARVIVGNRK